MDLGYDAADPRLPLMSTLAATAPWTAERIAALRADTPGCAERIHLNNAGAGLMPRPVLAAIEEHLELESRLGGYEAEDQRAAEIEAAYQAIADLLGCRPGNVALVENATVAVAQALSSVPFERGDVLLTTRNDYVSNQIMYLSLARRLGIEVVRAPDAPEGGVDVEAFGALLAARRPRLAALTHVPTNSGLVQPAAALGRLCREAEVPYLVDACQSVGQLAVAVADLHCDFLAATCRKFLRGPRGQGLLFVSDAVLDRGWEPLLPDMRGAVWTGPDQYAPATTARRFENWEFAHALVLGAGEAARYAARVGMPAIASRTPALAARLRRGLAAIGGVRLLDRGRELCGIVTLTLSRLPAERLHAALAARHINASVSRRGFALLDFTDKGVDAALRLAPHYYNTEEEIDAAVAAIAEVAGG